MLILKVIRPELESIRAKIVVTNAKNAVNDSRIYIRPELEDTLVADSSPISELLNMAWAFHEITDENIREVTVYEFDFLFT